MRGREPSHLALRGGLQMIELFSLPLLFWELMDFCLKILHSFSTLSAPSFCLRFSGRQQKTRGKLDSAARG